MIKKVFDKGDMSIVRMECGATFKYRGRYPNKAESDAILYEESATKL